MNRDDPSDTTTEKPVPRTRGDEPDADANGALATTWGRLREGAESYAKALASDILR